MLVALQVTLLSSWTSVTDTTGILIYLDAAILRRIGKYGDSFPENKKPDKNADKHNKY